MSLLFFMWDRRNERFVPLTACLIHNNYQLSQWWANVANICPLLSQRQNLRKPHQRSLVKGFIKITENNYVIKDPSKHEILNQCWADVGPAAQTLGQHQPSIVCVCRDGLSQAVTHSGEGLQQRRDIEHVLVKCWPIVNDAGLTLKQHKGNVTCLLGGGGVLMAPIAVLLYSLMRGWPTSLCVYTYA